MAKLLLGKEVNASINEEIKAKVETLKAQNITPTLGIIRIGEREDDIAYERGATKRCETLGVAYEKFLLPADVEEEEVLKTIDQVNKSEKIHGVLLFRPLPKHLNEDKIVNALAVEKDVDGITDLSMAGVFMGKDMGYAPCTPSACMKVLDHYGIDCTGKKVVVIGRSLVVGKPAAMMLIKKNATVTVCHTKTVDMPSVAKEADIIMGSREEFDLTEKLIKEGMTDEESASLWQGYNAKIVVIKHGMKGSTAYTCDGQKFSIKPFPVEARKGFGGGDGYGSGFLYGLYQGWEVIDCLEFGSAEASMMVRSNNCSDSLPGPDAVHALSLIHI